MEEVVLGVQVDAVAAQGVLGDARATGDCERRGVARVCQNIDHGGT